jgi:hypothetical protein
MDDIPIETTIDHTGGEQNTGNHNKPGAPDQGGADRFGGTRSGSANVEQPVTNIEKGTDVDRLADLEDQLDDSISVNGPTERIAERDEHGRM